MESINKLEELFEKYNFDYIFINPNDIIKIDFLYIPEEIFTDFKSLPNYLGAIKVNNINIEVYWDKKITPGDVIFKYKNIKKERSAKLSNIIHDSID